MLISMLLHIFILFSLQLYFNKNSTIKKNTTHILNVRLVTTFQAPRVQPSKKLLTIRGLSPIKVTEAKLLQPAPQQPNEPIAQDEPITGIAMPGAIASPFSGLRTEGSAFFKERYSQQNDMGAYQTQMINTKEKQLSEQKAQILIAQLKVMLAKVMADEPVIDGQCLININTHQFDCSSVALKLKISKVERTAVGMFNSLASTGKQYNGFVFNKQYAPETPLLINGHFPLDR